jgi:exodeoxyribonuclease VII small subunit
MTEKNSKTTKKQPSFEESLDELDMIIHKMESRDLGLTESLAAYEKGVSLLRHLHEELSDIEQRVVTLVRIDEDGTPVFEKATGSAES